MWRFAFRSVVLAALVVFNILAGTDARAESGFLDIINTTDAEVSVIAVADDKSQTVLYQLPAGETYSLPVEAGTLLGFASGDSWVGDGYVVSGGDGESVSVPYAEAEAGAAAAEPAGNEITLKNTTAAKVMVIAIGDDGTQQKVADIAAKKSARVNVPAGTLLGFAQNGDWLGDGYVVSEEADQSASIPYKEKTQAAAGGGVTVGNTSETAITVVSIGSDGKQTALFNVPAGKSASVAIKKGTLLGFAQAGAWLGDGYTVTGGENETVMVPVIAEAAAAAAPEAEQSEAGADQFPVKINNTNAMAIGVVVVAADGAQSILSQVKAGAAAQFNLSAGTKLGFSIKDETGKLAWSGDAFIVPDGGGEVQVPYQAVAQAETPAAGDAQEKAKAALSPLQIAQAGEGSVKINFSNTQANAIVVAALGDDKSPVRRQMI